MDALLAAVLHVEAEATRIEGEAQENLARIEDEYVKALQALEESALAALRARLKERAEAGLEGLNEQVAAVEARADEVCRTLEATAVAKREEILKAIVRAVLTKEEDE